MFFIGVFGIEDKSKEIKTLDSVTCKCCKTGVTVRLIKKYSFFHLFFIPIFKWNESYYIICNRCNRIFSIPKEKGKAMENEENIEIIYWDMIEVSNDFDIINRCKNCGAEIDKNFIYCPKCGEKIR
ncbi:zinc ribbon domain-containing protein [Clostridium sp. SHJSY1]|uniref:zinc ribbon domain-containing protein n=1 Tax=Clostridium sp. SHJSY1 TaxID=2942483 RepID=UPI0028755BAB|nr:zinc ribbon domain-containing protein [Clostridium sp. SHJSY1]MDS0524184.1 zinc ribbon domain-containing protein [Clostridium sp. SHJSY1]